MNRAPQRGVTFIECLVVIVIIGVLGIILIPTIASVRESTNRSVCAANLKQIGAAVISFASENNGKLPPPAFSSCYLENWGPSYRPSPKPPFSSEEALKPYLGNPHRPWREPSAEWRAVTRCPSGNAMLRKKDYSKMIAEADRRTTYYAFWSQPHTDPDDGTGHDGSPMSLRDSGKSLLAGDSAPGLMPESLHQIPSNHAINSNPIKPAGANWVHLDGHVRWYSASELTGYVRKDTKQRVPVP